MRFLSVKYTIEKTKRKKESEVAIESAKVCILRVVRRVSGIFVASDKVKIELPQTHQTLNDHE